MRLGLSKVLGLLNLNIRSRLTAGALGHDDAFVLLRT